MRTGGGRGSNLGNLCVHTLWMVPKVLCNFSVFFSGTPKRSTTEEAVVVDEENVALDQPVKDQRKVTKRHKQTKLTSLFCKK